MSVLNNDRILNGTPEKRLMNAYNTMKKNYTEESANEFSKSYMTESLSFVVTRLPLESKTRPLGLSMVFHTK